MGPAASDPLASCCSANTYNLELNDNPAEKPSRAHDQAPQVPLPHLIKIQSRVKGWLQRARFEEQMLQRREKSTHFLATDQRETLSGKRELEIAVLYKENVH